MLLRCGDLVSEFAGTLRLTIAAGRVGWHTSFPANGTRRA